MIKSIRVLRKFFLLLSLFVAFCLTTIQCMQIGSVRFNELATKILLGKTVSEEEIKTLNNEEQRLLREKIAEKHAEKQQEVLLKRLNEALDKGELVSRDEIFKITNEDKRNEFLTRLQSLQEQKKKLEEEETFLKSILLKSLQEEEERKKWLKFKDISLYKESILLATKRIHIILNEKKPNLLKNLENASEEITLAKKKQSNILEPIQKYFSLLQEADKVNKNRGTFQQSKKEGGVIDQWPCLFQGFAGSHHIFGFKYPVICGFYSAFFLAQFFNHFEESNILFDNINNRILFKKYFDYATSKENFEKADLGNFELTGEGLVKLLSIYGLQFVTKNKNRYFEIPLVSVISKTNPQIQTQSFVYDQEKGKIDYEESFKELYPKKLKRYFDNHEKQVSFIIQTSTTAGRIAGHWIAAIIKLDWENNSLQLVLADSLADDRTKLDIVVNALYDWFLQQWNEWKAKKVVESLQTQLKKLRISLVLLQKNLVALSNALVTLQKQLQEVAKQ